MKMNNFYSIIVAIFALTATPVLAQPQNFNPGTPYTPGTIVRGPTTPAYVGALPAIVVNLTGNQTFDTTKAHDAQQPSAVFISSDATAITYTFSAPKYIGERVYVVQGAAGAITLAPGTGMTFVTKTGKFTTQGAGSTAMLTAISTTKWVISSGDLN